jgi:glycosyltransferase involved in cell wall biosynthesis
MYPPPFSSVGYVFTMHDISPFAHPDFYPSRIRAGLSPLIRRGLRKARLIVCPSEHARETTAERFRVEPDRISVVHHGIDARFRPLAAEETPDTVRERYHIRAPYALYVGKLMLRKNIVRMLEAFDLLRRDAPELTLVLCGRRFWDSRFLDEAIARLRLQDRVVELGYVPDADLPPLYAGAEMALYPTLFEGFGFPVLEAMACGTPVVTSNVSCLPEIAGNAALLVNPESVEEIAAAMLRLHLDPALRATLRAKGLARAAMFTWQRAAEQMVEVYRRASAL